MKLSLAVCILSGFIAGAAFAQTAPPPASPPAAALSQQVAPAPGTRGPGPFADLTPEQRTQMREDRKACRQELRGKDMERSERRKAMGECMAKRNPIAKERMAAVEMRRGEMRKLRSECRDEVRRKDLARSERRQAMDSCLIAKKPELKKVFDCRDQARSKDMEGSERREFMRSCIRAG
jgi:Spy/CpxP family protein refolding chaperone